MRVTITQLSDMVPEEEWRDLAAHTAATQPDLVVLGEMPFARWLAATDRVNEADWQEAVALHDAGLDRLDELGGAAVAGSRPVVQDGRPHNEGFLWTASGGYQTTHLKYYLPDEPGFWEASWYRRAPTKSFQAAPLGPTTCGFMICTDMWFTEHARGYASQGADLLIVPRATEASTAAKWLAGGRVGAVMAGAFSISGNRQGRGEGLQFGGMGWVIDPEGDVLATTTDKTPFVTHEIDLAESRAAKKSYPRYVAE